MSERICMWAAWHLPRMVVKWAFYRVLSNATTGEWAEQVVPDVTWQQAAKRWEGRKR